MNSFAYYNGQFGSLSEINVPLTDRSLYFGDGVYDAAIGVNGGIFLLREHIERLIRNIGVLGIKTEYTYDKLEQILNETVKRSGIQNFFLYFQLTRASENRIHSAVNCNGSNLLILIREFVIDGYDKKLNLITFEDRRFYYCDVKTLNLLPSVMASTEAEKKNCDEAVFHRGNIVTECAHSNVSILKNGVLITHPTDNLILPGITRRHLLCACETLGIPYEEREFTLDELSLADEIIVTSTTKLAKTAKTLNGISVGGKDEKNANLLCAYLEKELLQFADACKR